MNCKNFDTRPEVLSIKKIVKETDTIWTFIFEYELGSKPGQFVMLWIPGVDEKPFSIAYDSGKEFWLTIANVGPATKELFKLKVGDKVGIRGPFGTEFVFKKGDHLALLAGGYGSAPLYNVAVNALKLECTIEFIVGARTKDLLLYQKRVDDLRKKYPGKITYHGATNDGTAGHKGFNTELLEKILKEKKGITQVMTCGPEIMMMKGAELAKKHRIKSQVSIERYMKCGFGVCGQCCIDHTGERACKEGPVYDGEKALKLDEFGKYHRDSVGRKIHH